MSGVKTILLMAILSLLPACNRGGTQPVVVYVSVDQVHAEPVLQAFEKQSGIKVRAVYDVEASKTTGLANRIVAEKARPQADVFWNGEFVQTLRLKSEGLLAAAHPPGATQLPTFARDPEGKWFAVGGRFRAILVNKERLRAENRPRRLEDFANMNLAGSELAIALPLFGTSAAQAAALYATLGREKARELYRRLQTRGVRVVDGNSVVRDLVAQGAAAAGWADSDDACEALGKGAPVEMILPDQGGGGTLLIPGTVAKVAGAPHDLQAEALIDFLLQPATEQTLIHSGFFQVSVYPGGVAHPCLGGRAVKIMNVSLSDIAAHLEASRQDMTELFVR